MRVDTRGAPGRLPGPAPRARAVSTAHGPLRHVLLCYPEGAPGHPRYREAYEALLAELPSATRLTVLTHPDSASDLKGLLRVAGRRATVVPAELDFSVWAQDPYVAMRDADGEPSLLRPVSFERGADDGIADALAASTAIRGRRSGLWFHGGYVLVGDTFILVGRDCLDATLDFRRRAGHPAEGDPEELGAALFAEELDPDRRVIVVGTDHPVPAKVQRPVTVDGRERLEILHDATGRAQPLFHLDLFISLAGRGPSGRYRLLVGSPEMADRIIGRPSGDDALSPLFDDVADRLADEGFEVIRNPLPLTYADGQREIDGEERDVRLWYHATANNCLVQIDRRAGNHVWLPTYGHRAWAELASTDAENRRIWESLGFTVHELPSFHAFAQKSGALGCITKCLER